jgi:lipid-binding SYLF domain-containing protein
MNRRMMVLLMAAALAAPGIAFGADKAKEQAEVRKAGQDALAAVYKVAPSARKAVESAAGYAAFSNFGMKILVAGGGSGKGIAVNNKTKAMTYMKMAEIQAGLGLGAKKFQVVWVFETDAALNNRRRRRRSPKPKVPRIRARLRYHRESGSTRSRRKAWRSSSPPRERSTTRIVI